jgi:hypothetical protein
VLYVYKCACVWTSAGVVDREDLSLSHTLCTGLSLVAGVTHDQFQMGGNLGFITRAVSTVVQMECVYTGGNLQLICACTRMHVHGCPRGLCWVNGELQLIRCAILSGRSYAHLLICLNTISKLRPQDQPLPLFVRASARRPLFRSA